MKFSERLRDLGLKILARKGFKKGAFSKGATNIRQSASSTDVSKEIGKTVGGSPSARKAQRGYYHLASAAKVLEGRIDALACSIPTGSTILDIGCNDGTISSALIDRGVLKKAYGIDLENIIAHERPEFEFIEGDIRAMDIASLPDADGVLLLNVLHHLIRSSRKRAQEILDGLLQRYKFVFIDLGSFSEEEDRGWRRAIGRHWNSDAEMWDSLFQKAAWRFKLLRYPAQDGGHRVLWKLYHTPYELREFSVVQSFVKTPGSWPGDKALLPIGDVNELSKPPAGRVIFEKIISAQRDIFWVKRYLPPLRPGVASMEYEIWRAVKKNLEERKLSSEKKFAHLAVSELVEFPDPRVVCAIYEPDILASAAVHFQDWIKFFDASDAYLLGAFAARTISMRDLRRVKIIHICDFQAVSAWDGIKLIDFEPNFWARRFLLDKGE